MAKTISVAGRQVLQEMTGRPPVVKTRTQSEEERTVGSLGGLAALRAAMKTALKTQTSAQPVRRVVQEGDGLPVTGFRKGVTTGFGV